MAAKQSSKAKAWVLFDRIVDLAAPGGVHSNPWVKSPDGQLRFEPDYNTLVQLLGVPLHLEAETQSGVPALALDVWLSYELRRAGFGKDQAWPRPVHPRILPAPVAALLKDLPRKIGDAVAERLNKKRRFVTLRPRVRPSLARTTSSKLTSSSPTGPRGLSC